MALTFRPYPRPENTRPDLYEAVSQPLSQGLDAIVKSRQVAEDRKFRQFQMDMMKAKEQRELGAHMAEYGDPESPITTPGGFTQADPRLSLYQPATMDGETQFGNIGGATQPDSYAPREPQPGNPMSAGGGMVDRFRQWQESKRANAAGPDMNADLTDAQLMAPGMGSRRRDEYLKLREGRMKQEDFKRKGLEAEADIKLKGAQADYYKNYKGKTGRYTGWTPQSLETRKRNLLAQLRVAPLAEREDIMGDISEIDDIQGATLRNYGGGSAAGGTPGAAPKPVLGRRGAAPSQAAGGPAPKFKRGQVAINPQTKEKVMFNGAAWVPVPAGRL